MPLKKTTTTDCLYNHIFKYFPSHPICDIQPSIYLNWGWGADTELTTDTSKLRTFPQ